MISEGRGCSFYKHSLCSGHRQCWHKRSSFTGTKPCLCKLLMTFQLICHLLLVKKFTQNLYSILDCLLCLWWFVVILLLSWSVPRYGFEFGFWILYVWVHLIVDNCYYISSHRCSELNTLWQIVSRVWCLRWSPHICVVTLYFDSILKFNDSCLLSSDAFCLLTNFLSFLIICF